MNGTYTGIIDRIVDGKHVVLEVSKDEEWVGEINTSVEEIPEEYQYEGALFEVEIQNDELVGICHQPGKERERRERVKRKMERTAVSKDELDLDDIT